MSEQAGVAAMIDRLMDHLADDTWRRQFLPALDVTEVATTRLLFEPVVAQVLADCGKLAIVSIHTIVPSTLGAIIQLGHLPAESIATQVKANLWLPAIDDVMDNAGVSHVNVEKVAAECLGALDGAPRREEVRTDPALLLADLRQRLAATLLWQNLGNHWIASASDVVKGSIWEREHRVGTAKEGPATWPSLDQYMDRARHTIGIRFLWINAMLLEADPSSARVIPALLILADHCAAAMRVANDLATLERDMRDGDLNAVTILARNLPDGAESDRLLSAQNSLRANLEAERTQAHQAGVRARTQTGVEKRLLRALEFGLAMYAIADFREWARKADEKGTAGA